MRYYSARALLTVGLQVEWDIRLCHLFVLVWGASFVGGRKFKFLLMRGYPATLGDGMHENFLKNLVGCDPKDLGFKCIVW